MCGSSAHLEPVVVAAPARQPVAVGARGGQYRAAPVTDADFPRPAPATAPTFARSVVLAKIGELEAANDRNTSAALIIGLAGGPGARAAALELAEIDRRCAARGYILRAEEVRREELVRSAVGILGFDPRVASAPTASPAAPAAPVASEDARPVLAAVVADVGALAPAPLALPEGVTQEPLRAGDWRGLWLRVQAGQLSEADARAFGQLWKDAGL